MQSTQIVLRQRPVGAPNAETFEVRTSELPDIQDGEVLLAIRYLSLDPYMRGRLSTAKSYAAPVEIGQVMVGATVGQVLATRHERLHEGDWVVSYSGWQTHAAEHGDMVRKLDPSIAPVTTALGVLGMPGMTAYWGLLEIGRPQPGETVVVAAATGPVGSAVGQIARIKGARAVGIAGGPEKCRLLVDTFGFDAAVDHRAPDFVDQLVAATPDGIDVNDAKDAILAMNPEQMDEGYQFVDFLAYAELDAPTQTVNFAKPLPKGHYAVVCFLPVGGGEDGPLHLMEGMITDYEQP